MMRVTLKEVARECGVSLMTVSNVMNGRTQKVSQKTIDDVMEVAKRLNYIPNAQARSLASKKSRLIAVIVPQTEGYPHHMMENPFYGEFVGGVEEAARLRGYSIILRAVGQDAEDLSRLTLSWNVDGALVVGILRDRCYEIMQDLRIPILLVDSYVNDGDFYRFNIDDEAGAHLAVSHLIARGHRNIAFVSGRIQKDGVIEKRYLGYKRALRDNGIDNETVIEGEVSFEYGINCAKTIIDTHGISAVFAMADILAIGLLRGFYQNGKNVPRDYSVVGFDDAYFARMTVPALTTVNQNITLRGHRAAEILIDSFENQHTGEETRRFLSPLIISERDSVRNI